MKTLSEYLNENYDKGVIDHMVRASFNDDGTMSFYIHADGYDSDTLDFVVKENRLWNVEDIDDFRNNIKNNIEESLRSDLY